MSGAFYHYQQRCKDLEQQLSNMTTERDHYFTVSEDYRCQLGRLRDEIKGAADPIQASVVSAIDGKLEVRIPEIVSAMGSESTTGLQMRIGLCLRKLGWTKSRSRDHGYVMLAPSA